MKLLKFSTADCGNCKIISGHVNKYAKEKGFEVEEVDAIMNTMKRDQYEVMGVPTIVIVDELGAVKEKVTGAPQIMEHIYLSE